MIALRLFMFTDLGYAAATYSQFRLEADNYVDLVSPTTVSTEGGALLTLTGYGFKPLMDMDAGHDMDHHVSMTSNNPDMETQVVIDTEEVDVVFANSTQVCLLNVLVTHPVDISYVISWKLLLPGFSFTK